jgi:hypothetical protein
MTNDKTEMPQKRDRIKRTILKGNRVYSVERKKNGAMKPRVTLRRALEDHSL